MKALARTRIILFALMIFGAFANFALNEWGIKIIKYCELLMTMSFLAEYAFVLANRIKNNERKRVSQVQLVLLFYFVFGNLLMLLPVTSRNEILGVVLLIDWAAIFLIVMLEFIYDLIKRKENKNKYENFFLSMFFYGLYFKNMAWPGAAAILIFSCLFLLPYYIVSTIKFFRTNYKSGKLLIFVLTAGSIATILLSLTFVSKTMHWPFGNEMYYIALGLTVIMIIGTIKWKYTFKNESVSVLQGLRLFKSHIVFIYFLALIFLVYRHMAVNKKAPVFHSQFYPATVYKMRDMGFTTKEKEAEYVQLVDIYDLFVENSKKNGLIE